MKNVSITVTLPEETLRDLHSYISFRQRSKFIANLVKKGLEEEKERLAREFREAAGYA